MPRIQGVDLPADKPTHISLRYLRGIGPTLALRLCDQAGVDPQRRAKELSDDEIARIAAILDREDLIEGAPRRTETANVERLKHNGSYPRARAPRNPPDPGRPGQRQTPT